MDIERYDPWEEFNRLRQQINALFAGFFDRMPHTLRHVSFAPPADVYQTDNTLVLRFDLAGVVEDDVDIAATETDIVIRGERDRPADAPLDGHYRRELPYGFFERKIELPVRVKPLQLSAEYVDGLLVIRLPIA
jgi:HSP20 family protein